MLKQQYELADTSPSEMETYTLGILFGNDHYYDIMLDKREVFQENLYILESKLGWILSGRTTIRELQDKNILFLLSTLSHIPSELHKMNRENQIAMFKPNVEDLWNADEFDLGRGLEDNKQKEQIIFEISGAQPGIEEHINISPFEIDEKRH